MFDWVTWSIWLLGFIILVIWIWLPIREFRQLLKERQEQGGEQPS
jgi:hypothetical protein